MGQWELCTDRPQHVRSMSLIPLVQIAAGGEQSFALSLSGVVFGWGRNDRGQLGLGNRAGIIRNKKDEINSHSLKSSLMHFM